MHIRKVEMKDLTEIMRIYAIAQDFMISTGNPDQWCRFYPKEELIEDDINNGVCHAICEMTIFWEELFMLFKGLEPIYSYIEKWKMA